MKKAKTLSFILELKLNTEIYQKDILDKRFAIAEKIYNKTLKHANKQLKRMRENKSYKKILNQYFGFKKAKDSKNVKLYSNLLNSIKESYDLTEYGLHSFVLTQQHLYKKHIDSNTSQKIASTVWKAIEAVLFKTGKKVHFKKFGQLTSVEGKANTSGIRFIDNKLVWGKLSIPVDIRKNDLFIKESLESRIKYCRIIRKPFKGGNKYFLQLVMEGLPPIKRNNKDGSFRHKETPNNKVGVDIGTSTIAVCSDKKVILTELAPNVRKYKKDINNLYRKLQRSRIATNPDNYNPDGTIKRGIKLKWVRSKNYMKTLFKLKDKYRQKSNYIKLSHNKLANEIVSLGDEVYVENMNFKTLQKRAKKTTINKKGKINKKKRFGKSLNNKAPAKLIEIIDRKLKYIDKNINKVNTTTFKASQYNHIEDRCLKKKLSQRWNYINKEYIQRDLYSAFLLMNSKKNLETTDRDLCIKTYDKFKENHNEYIDKLKESQEKLPSSFGIKITKTA